MKLNFWQWLGVILLIIAIVLIARRQIAPSTAPTQPSTSPATAP
jgi:hypothetical protein